MNILSNTLNREEIKQIAHHDDFHIAPYRPDGETFGTLTWIWSVEVDGQLFVRPYYGQQSRWYQAALKQEQGKITGGGLEKLVRFAPVDGPIQEAIDAAYRAKYAGSPYLSAMISDRAKSGTIQILPAANA